MKDAKGHGSDQRGGPAHGSGVDQIGRQPVQPGVWYHGSPAGDPGNGPVHVGTELAAKQALEARIGIPADGKGWDGTRDYGKTLIAGQDTLERMDPRGYNKTGYNAGGPNEAVPRHDYYPSDRATRAKFGDGTPIPDSARPAVRSYNIVGNMSNNTSRPTTDTRANAMSGRLKNQGTYYKNIGEDEGSVSAVVPSKTFLQRTK